MARCKYKKEYPDYTSSIYYKMLEKESIPAILELYSLNTDNLPAEIVILDNQKPIFSIKELTEHFAGKPVFVDCWGSWCGPCIGDFQFNKPLKEFLDKYNIVKVYIAIEKYPNIEKWKAFISKGNLSGYHIRLNDSIEQDLTKNLGLSRPGFPIPRYILIDKKGKIVLKDALRPGDKEKLYDQIRLALK